MSVTFNITPEEIFDSIRNEIEDDIDIALDESAEFMAKQLDLSFENSGMLMKNMRGKGFEPYTPTTIAAKRGRKNPPTGRRLWVSNSLEDTGKMRSTLAIEKDNTKDEMSRFVGVGVPYIESVENGGSVTVDGVTYDVPPRHFQHMTDEEQAIIYGNFEKALS